MDSTDNTEQALLERLRARTRQLREAREGLREAEERFREAEEGLELFRREVEIERQVAMDHEVALAMHRGDDPAPPRGRRLENGWNGWEIESDEEFDSEFEDESEMRVDPSQRACVACMDNLSDDDDDAHASPCGHKWCRTCLINRYDMAAKSTHMFPAYCCNRPILPDNDPLIAPETWTRYFQKRAEVDTPNPTFCSKRDCSKFIPIEDVNEGQAKCVCGHSTCVECKAEWHTGECVPDPEREQLLSLAREQQWQTCFHCKVIVDRIDGCNEMSMSTMLSPPSRLCFETPTDVSCCRLRALRIRLLLCVWQAVEDMPLPSVRARRA